MPRIPGMKAMPWMRMWWLAQIVMAGIRELAPAERKQARELASKLARERRLSRRDREHLSRLAKKVGKGAARGARGRKRR